MSYMLFLSLFGLLFFLKYSYIFEKPRDFLSKLHPFIFKLFDCAFCLGCHIGWIHCLIIENNITFALMFTYIFGSGGFCIIMDGIFKKLYYGV